MGCIDTKVLPSGAQIERPSVFNEFPGNSHDILAQKMDYSGCSLQEVAKACLEPGNEEAWCELLRRTQPVLSGAVRRACLGYGLDPYQYSDDLVQAVYVKLLEKSFKLLKTLASGDDQFILRYLRVVASNRVADLCRELRNKKQNLFVTDSLESLSQELPDHKTTDANMTLLLDKVDRILSDILSGPNAGRDKAVFWLYFRHGLTAGQAAAAPGIGLSESDVEVLLRRLIRALRKKMR
jgi:RNA polymerase sigma factor (sigma-70 family)